MLLQKLVEQKLIQPPRWLPDNTAFLCQAGSVMYGANIGNSDIDVHGFCFAPREVTFPHLGGAIEGFGTQIQRFRVWQQHHVKTLDGNKEYDFCVYNVVDFVQLAMETNPNVLELLFAPRRCVLHSTAAFEHLRDNRHLFLMKGVMHKLRGYAFRQLNKAKNKDKPKVIEAFEHKLASLELTSTPDSTEKRKIVNNLREELRRRNMTNAISNTKHLW